MGSPCKKKNMLGGDIQDTDFISIMFLATRMIHEENLFSPIDTFSLFCGIRVTLALA